MGYKRVLICGGRDFTDWQAFRAAMHAIAEQYLDRLLPDKDGNYSYDATVISGGAKGADSMAIDWAAIERLDFREFQADWAKHGKRAGYLRNKQMLDEGKPDLVVAFPGGKGTQMMVDLAIQAGVLVLKVCINQDGSIQVDELNAKPVELTTARYKQIFIDRVKQLGVLTPGQRAGIFRDLILEEQRWLKNMDSDYNDIMQAVEAMDKAQS